MQWSRVISFLWGFSEAVIREVASASIFCCLLSCRHDIDEFGRVEKTRKKRRIGKTASKNKIPVYSGSISWQ
jgi:hypothetical protein